MQLAPRCVSRAQQVRRDEHLPRVALKMGLKKQFDIPVSRRRLVQLKHIGRYLTPIETVHS